MNKTLCCAAALLLLCLQKRNKSGAAYLCNATDGSIRVGVNDSSRWRLAVCEWRNTAVIAAAAAAAPTAAACRVNADVCSFPMSSSKEY